MQFTFYKYHGTGNDFILVDNRDARLTGMETDLFHHWCDRHFGIGADGVILLCKDAETHFRMDYFNSDGNRSSMCGNGGRCMVEFARHLGIITDHARFVAIDGLHEAQVTGMGIRLKMTLPQSLRQLSPTDWWVHTGSPHLVRFSVEDVSSLDVKKTGAEIRYSDAWKAEGTNVNFVNILEDGSLRVRTYERGVEDETLSCGTGVTAAAVVYNHLHQNGKDGLVKISTPGGLLQVHLHQQAEPELEGAATFVFTGEING
jgi:diaminopimelate epimerase